MDKKDRIKELREQIIDLRESGAEPEDIALLVLELNQELVKGGDKDEN